MSTPAPDVDTIRLTGLSARNHHGVLPSERREGQLFVVDVTLGLGFAAQVAGLHGAPGDDDRC